MIGMLLFYSIWCLIIVDKLCVFFVEVGSMCECVCVCVCMYFFFLISCVCAGVN
jgi:hypothetical protein